MINTRVNNLLKIKRIQFQFERTDVHQDSSWDGTIPFHEKPCYKLNSTIVTAYVKLLFSATKRREFKGFYITNNLIDIRHEQK
jgi:hypothetical protein